jgi:hypothetical protein
MHARGLRLRGVQPMLAITHPPVLPSAMLNGVGTPVAIISQLNTLPALPPVNASMAASRLTTHDSGPGWLATPFLYDSFIHNSTPVLSRRTQQPARQHPRGYSAAASFEYTARAFSKNAIMDARSSALRKPGSLR